MTFSIFLQLCVSVLNKKIKFYQSLKIFRQPFNGIYLTGRFDCLVIYRINGFKMFFTKKIQSKENHKVSKNKT